MAKRREGCVQISAPSTLSAGKSLPFAPVVPTAGTALMKDYCHLETVGTITCEDDHSGTAEEEELTLGEAGEGEAGWKPMTTGPLCTGQCGRGLGLQGREVG